MTITSLRQADLSDLAEVLQNQAAARHDVVAHSSALRYEDGNLLIAGADAVITADGVTRTDTCLVPTDIFEEGLSQRLDIPRRYIRKMRSADAARLLDDNVNHWLAASERNWFVRGFKDDGEDCGIGRAFLSDRFNCYDNFDVLLAVLDGVRAGDTDVKVVGADLSERRMTVRVQAPSVAALAPTLLRGYRSPFTGETGDENPTVFAGFVISNSETGGGAFSITPRLVVQVCNNGMTFTKDALRKVHLGAAMDEGVIRWSDDTNRKNIELVTAQARDAVATFCDISYVEAKLADITAQAEVRIASPTKVIDHVAKSLSFTNDEAEGILSHFIEGGSLTAGGVLAAVTSYAQVVLDPDRANEIEEAGVPALTLAASFS